MEEISHSASQPPCYSLRGVHCARGRLRMLNILKTEPWPCYCGLFFFSSLFINFSLQEGFFFFFFESGGQHSVDPVGEPRRNVKWKRWDRLHSGFIEFACGQSHCCLADFITPPPKAALPFLLLCSLHPILVPSTFHGFSFTSDWIKDLLFQINENFKTRLKCTCRKQFISLQSIILHPSCYDFFMSAFCSQGEKFLHSTSEKYGPCHNLE